MCTFAYNHTCSAETAVVATGGRSHSRELRIHDIEPVAKEIKSRVGSQKAFRIQNGEAANGRGRLKWAASSFLGLLVHK